MESIASILKAFGHQDRLRIIALLAHGELTISELVQILKLSQPRVTQYIKALEAVGVLERIREGSWVFSRINRQDPVMFALLESVLKAIPKDDPIQQMDKKRLEAVRQSRAKAANMFFAQVAQDKNQLGHEYLPQRDIETALLNLAQDKRYDYMIDMGTGTGRMLELFAPFIARGTGIDISPDMLAVARHKLAAKALSHISVQQGDLYNVALPAASADLVTLHQVLHYLDDPMQAIITASRLLNPKGRVVIIDFSAHQFEDYREKYAHRRLGFSDLDMSNLLSSAKMTLNQSVNIPSHNSQAPDVKIWIAENHVQSPQKIAA